MKKYFTIFCLLILIAGCSAGNNKTSSADSSTTDSSPATPAATAISANDVQKGFVLIIKYDCSTCHKNDKKVIGPAFEDVANKYAGNDTAVTYLAHKVINGGGGVWGTVPMSKHVNLSESDAEEIIKYVLSLKTK